MARFIFDKVDPTTHSGINLLKNEVNSFNFKKYDDDTLAEKRGITHAMFSRDYFKLFS